MTSSNGNICVGNSPVTGESPAQRPITRSFDVFFDLRLNKRLSKQLWGWWFETLSRPLWRHCNAFWCESASTLKTWARICCWNCNINISKICLLVKARVPENIQYKKFSNMNKEVLTRESPSSNRLLCRHKSESKQRFHEQSHDIAYHTLKVLNTGRFFCCMHGRWMNVSLQEMLLKGQTTSSSLHSRTCPSLLRHTVFGYFLVTIT